MDSETIRTIGLILAGLVGFYCLYWIWNDQKKVDECKRKSAEMTEQAQKAAK